MEEDFLAHKSIENANQNLNNRELENIKKDLEIQKKEISKINNNLDTINNSIQLLINNLFKKQDSFESNDNKQINNTINQAKNDQKDLHLQTKKINKLREKRILMRVK